MRNQDDAESHSTASNHSDYSTRVLHRPKPLTVSQDKAGQRYSSPVRETAISGELNLSSMSRLSGISSSSNTTDTPPHSRLDVKTSTPKVKSVVTGARAYSQPDRPKSVNVEVARYQGGNQQVSQRQDDQTSASRVYGSYSVPKRSNDIPSTVSSSQYSGSSVHYGQSPTSSQHPDDRLSSGSSHKSEDQQVSRSSYHSNSSYSRSDNPKTHSSSGAQPHIPSSQMNSYLGQSSSDSITVPPHSQPQNYIGQLPLNHFVGMSHQPPTLQYSSGSEPVRSPPPPPAVAAASSRPATRELPPTPPERNLCLSPTERLDRMTSALQASGSYNNSSNSCPNQNNSAERPSREVRPQRNPTSQPPVSSSGHFTRVISRPPSSGSSVIGSRGAGDHQNTHARQTASQALFPQGRPNILIKRPTSALGQASNHLLKNDMSVYSTSDHSQYGDDRRSGISGSSMSSNSPNITHTVTFHNNNINSHPQAACSKQVERPKSVPPHLFNPALHGSGDDQPNSRGVIPPVAPPRRNRDPVPATISLLREPAIVSRPSNNNTPGPQQPGPQQQPSPSSHTNPQSAVERLLSSHSSRPQPSPSSQTNSPSAVERLLSNHSSRPPPSQTPMARIQPQTKPVNSRPPLSRPVKTEEQASAAAASQQQQQQQQQQGPKQNAVWYEYGCV